MALKFHFCLLLLIVGITVYAQTGNAALCDWPHGVCVYSFDACPPNSTDCQTSYNCTLDTNKCCCWNP